MNIEIHHHNYFQILAPNNIKSEDVSNRVLEQAYYFGLPSNADKVKYPDINFRIYLPSSIVYASTKLFNNNVERTNFLNDYIDNEFCNMVIWLRQSEKIKMFIEIHYKLFDGKKKLFREHINFEIIPRLEKIIEAKKREKENPPEFITLSGIIRSWLSSKQIRRYKYLWPIIATISALISAIIALLAFLK
jgi:hypothetical protein